MSVVKKNDPVEFHVYIGGVKIAEIAFNNPRSKWKAYMRLMGNELKEYGSMSEALKDLHEMLQSPPSEEGVNSND
jgi:hypothetical protein